MAKGTIEPLGKNIGARFGNMVVIEETSRQWVRYAKLRCDCGNVCEKPLQRVLGDIRRGLEPSCGCMTTMKRRVAGVRQFLPESYVQKRFDRLLVTGVDLDLSRKTDKYRLVCLCDCGAQHLVAARFLNNGDVRSCGCLATETAVEAGHATIAHGHTTNGVIGGLTPIYTCWLAVRALCAMGWKRGAHRVCHEYDKRWDEFVEFHRDFGDILRTETVYRLDRQKPWSKDNCYVGQGKRTRRTGIVKPKA
jgi:hypothetical protein